MNYPQPKSKSPLLTAVTFWSDLNVGLPVVCYVCGAQHKALGFARITHNNAVKNVPLCEPCLAADEKTPSAIMRKFHNAPDLQITEGGEATTEQVVALVEKQDNTEH
jgi:hypothetical protein